MSPDIRSIFFSKDPECQSTTNVNYMYRILPPPQLRITEFRGILNFENPGDGGKRAGKFQGVVRVLMEFQEVERKKTMKNFRGWWKFWCNSRGVQFLKMDILNKVGVRSIFGKAHYINAVNTRHNIFFHTSITISQSTNEAIYCHFYKKILNHWNSTQRNQYVIFNSV